MIEIAPSFKLNGKHFTKNQLIAHAKVCKVHEDATLVSMGVFLDAFLNDLDVVEVQTSGSTGKPKTITLLKKHMINSAKATGEFFNLSASTTALLCLSPNYIAGKMMLVRALVLGWEIDVISPQKHAIQAVDKSYDFTAMVPLQVSQNLNKIPLFKTLLIGGGAVNNTVEEALKSVPTQCFVSYGMTETITHIAVKNISKNQASYKALPGVQFKTDHRSCLVIDAPKVASDLVITNDIVSLLDSHHFNWLGRFDNIINSGGVKLFPERIEAVLASLISTPFFVYGIPDHSLGEKLVLFIQSETLANKLSESALLQEIISKTNLGTYQIPKQIFFMANFVYTPTNKINRSKTVTHYFNSMQ